MKMSINTSKVVSSGGLVGEKSGFKINATSHAFRMLSSGLYSDKIRAVLREIGCNAYDAHVAAGIQDKPFEVKLPTQLNQDFYIKDYGPGLSHEDVINLYTSYFSSTKQQSNEFTGAFGLGSKSPFSYTDSFVLTSVHGGKKRVYTMHIDRGDEPAVQLMSEVDADPTWKSGVMVSFPVKPQDVQEFHRTAQFVFCSFATIPDVAGCEVEKLKLLEENEDWGMLDPTGKVAHMVPHPCVLMGNVIYPLSMHQVGPSFTANRASSVVIKCPIGSVEVAASREELQYSQSTIDYLKPVVEKVFKSMLDEAYKKFLAERNGSWQERLKLANYMKSVFTTVFGAYHSNLEPMLNQLYGKSEASDICKLIYRHNERIEHSEPVGKCKLIGIRKYSMHSVQYSSFVSGKENIYLDLYPDTKIVDGRKKGSMAKARLAILAGEVRQVIYLKPLPGGTDKDYEHTKDYLEKRLGKMDELQIDKVVLPKRRKLAKGVKAWPIPVTGETVYEMTVGKDVEISECKDKVFVLLDRATGYVGGRIGLMAGNSLKNYEMNNVVLSFMRLAQQLGTFKMPQIVQVTKRQMKKYKLEEVHKWISFDEWAKNTLGDPKLHKALVNRIKASKTKYYLGHGSSNTGFVINFAALVKYRINEESTNMAMDWMKTNAQDIHAKIEHVLANVGTGASIQQDPIPQIFDDLRTKFACNVKSLSLKKDLLSLDAPILDRMQYHAMHMIARVSKGALTAVIESALKEK